MVQNFTLDAIPDNNRHPEIVVYSMGNLVSNQRDVNTDGGIMVELTLTKFRTRGIITQRCLYMPYWVYRGTVDSLYQYYIVPSADAAANPERYQIEGNDLKALRLFDENTRARLAACALPDGANIGERQFSPFKQSRTFSTVPTAANILIHKKNTVERLQPPDSLRSIQQK